MFLVILCSFMIQLSHLSSLLPAPGTDDNSLAATGFWEAGGVRLSNFSQPGDASLFADTPWKINM